MNDICVYSVSSNVVSKRQVNPYQQVPHSRGQPSCACNNVKICWICFFNLFKSFLNLTNRVSKSANRVVVYSTYARRWSLLSLLRLRLLSRLSLLSRLRLSLLSRLRLRSGGVTILTLLVAEPGWSWSRCGWSWIWVCGSCRGAHRAVSFYKRAQNFYKEMVGGQDEGRKGGGRRRGEEFFKTTQVTDIHFCKHKRAQHEGRCE